MEGPGLIEFGGAGSRIEDQHIAVVYGRHGVMAGASNHGGIEVRRQRIVAAARDERAIPSP